MRKQKMIVLICFIWSVWCLQVKATEDVTASFDYFKYQGKDVYFDRKINFKKEYFNPILSGFYPDPSICRKDDTYYLVTSSFSFYPGVPIFKSQDLVNWIQIGHVLDRPSQLNLDGLDISSGIFAPAIEYNKYNDTFYMITTNVGGIGNFIVKTRDPEKEWSDPILLPNVQGIDPSLFFDDDGKAYIVHNDAPNIEEWQGHRVIRMHEYDVEKDKITGVTKIVIDGGVDKARKPIWIEAPHLYKKNGLYYIMAAEGGTAEDHSEVIFRSESAMGRYEPYVNNPILTQRDLEEERPDKITCTGHADIIETEKGEWWAVFLGCRPYENNYYNTGRETFLLPVFWKDGYPIILPKGERIPTVVGKDKLQKRTDGLSGNFIDIDDFNQNKLGMKWNWIRTPRHEFYTISDGRLHIKALPVNLEEKKNSATLCRRQQHAFFEAETILEFTPMSGNDLAGMVAFQNENYHIVFGKTIENGHVVMVVDRKDGQKKRVGTYPIPTKFESLPVKLKIEGKGSYYNFYVSFENNNWMIVAENVDARNLSTAKAGGFVGAYLGLYATSYALNASLKEVYNNYFDLGVATSAELFKSNSMVDFIKKHFNSVTAENAMKPGSLLDDKGNFKWNEADELVRFAKDNNLKVRGHTLVWHSQTPECFFKDDNGMDLDSTTLYLKLERYMDQVFQHFGKQVYCWDVVNEALSDHPDEIYRTEKSAWYRICKEHFIEKSFRMAHQLNPDAKLFYNDYNLTDSLKRRKAYFMLKKMKEKGVPIHGVGMQSHWSMQDIKAEEIQKSIDLFSSLGLDIHITELDLTVYPTYHGDGIKNQPKKTIHFTPNLREKQGEVYKMIFEVFRKNKSKISSVTLWGVHDHCSWLNNFPISGRTDYPLLFDEKILPKKSFFLATQF